MKMFDSIITEADEQFNLKGKAGTLLASLLPLMTDGAGGGLTGFLERLDATADSSEISTSLINTGENTEISNDRLESALGKEKLNDISKRINCDYDETVSAAVFMIPRVVDALTPDGVMPQDSDLLSRIENSLDGIEDSKTDENNAEKITREETFDRIGTAADSTSSALENEVADANVVDRIGTAADDKIISSSNRANDNHKINNSPLGWILPLLLLGLLLTLGYWFCSKTPAENNNGVQVNTNAGNQ